MNWIAQICGGLAIGCSLIIYSRKSRKKLLVFKCAQDVFWLIHYLLLAAYSAAGAEGLCIVRSVVFYFRKTDKKGGKWVLYLFLALYAASAALTWKNVFSIFPAMSSSISTVAFWMKKPRHTKMLAILASACTLTYNVAVAHSLSVYVGVTITVLTSLISLLVKEKSASEEAPTAPGGAGS